MNYGPAYPVKVYTAIQKGETKIEIAVFEINGKGYGAIIMPVASGDGQLMSHFQKSKLRLEVGKTIEAAVAQCEKWIKANLGQDVVTVEKRTL